MIHLPTAATKTQPQETREQEVAPVQQSARLRATDTHARDGLQNKGRAASADAGEASLAAETQGKPQQPKSKPGHGSKAAPKPATPRGKRRETSSGQHKVSAAPAALPAPKPAKSATNPEPVRSAPLKKEASSGFSALALLAGDDDLETVDLSQLRSQRSAPSRRAKPSDFAGKEPWQSVLFGGLALCCKAAPEAGGVAVACCRH